MERGTEVAQGRVGMAISKNELVCNMNRQQEWPSTEKNGGLMCYPTSKDKEHEADVAIRR